jgi:hypothetical protein
MWKTFCKKLLDLVIISPPDGLGGLKRRQFGFR